MSNKTRLQTAREIVQSEIHEEDKRRKEFQAKQEKQEILIQERERKAKERSSVIFEKLVKRLRDICSDSAKENDLKFFIEPAQNNPERVIIYIGTVEEKFEHKKYRRPTDHYGSFLDYKDPQQAYFLGVIPSGKTNSYRQSFYWYYTKSIRGSVLVIEHVGLNNYSVQLDFKKDGYKFSDIRNATITQIENDLINSLAQNLERNNCFTIETRYSEDKDGKIPLLERYVEAPSSEGHGWS